MFSPYMDFALLLACVGLILTAIEKRSPAYQRAKRIADRDWQEELAYRRQLRERERHAKHALNARHHAMMRLYWQHSVWQWWLYVHRATQCRTPSSLNRYVTLAEMQCQTSPATPPAPVPRPHPWLPQTWPGGTP